MIIRICFLMAFVSFIGLIQTVNGQTVVQNSNVILNDSGGQSYIFDLQQNAAGTDVTSILFSIDASGSLVFDGSAVDEGSDWYLVQPGEELSLNTTTNGSNDLWGTVMSPAGLPDPPNDFTLPTPFFSNPLQLTAQSEIYLGFATNLGFPATLADRDVFGWLKLSILGSNGPGEEQDPAGYFLQLDESVIAYDSAGIFVGTTTVPEPATGLLWTACAVFLGCQRRRR